MKDNLTDEQKDIIDELVKRTNYLVYFSLTIVVFACLNLMAPDAMDRLDHFVFGGEEEQVETMIAEESSIPDDLIENGIHVRTGLAIGDGFEQVKATCLACHSSKLITQNRADREGWKKMIRWMQETQNLWDLGPNEDVILDYLAAHYSPEEMGRRANLTQIEWYELEQ